ncbi:cytochrome P450 [Rhizoctonia solani]|uniref:Cytochrome P450 n=1 Tax=Rhizoctonia solani TaxID=456999 RepID=A0A8H7IGG9_9AGAM|nr:cytochrome P450 [Rhizoctonia solani]
MTTPIPQPPAIPFLGNVGNIDTELPSRSFTLLAKQYGEIFALNLLGKSVVAISSVKLAQEVLDEKRFHKAIGTALVEVRNLVSDGLFTAYHGETNWGIAHRILMPAFGPLSIKGMFDDMLDVISQLVLKWERFGPEHEIDPTDDFTRLAFETIALCTFNYRLNTFYTEGEPPFVKAMGDFLKECFLRSRRPTLVQALSYGANAKYAADMEIMNQLANKIVKDRKDHPSDKKDLLNAMLLGKDPQTGQGLSEENIKAQMLTFLIAGHETTSGMLSFVMAHVMKNPDVYAKIRNEVDSVLGGEPIRFEHLSKLTYINAVLRESLRVTPSIGQFAVTPHKDEIIGGGKYLIKKDTIVIVLAADIGKDPTVWGEDADTFKPDRMLDGKFEALPPKAWLPFGNGARACIGRPFAWQEALIAIATIFQKFDFKPSDESYTLQLKQTLTLKPKDFKFHAIPRKGAPSFSVAAASSQSTNGPTPGKEVVDGESKGIPLYVFYGSNTGSCEGFAQNIASEAASKGYRATIGTLNSIVGNIPKDGPVIIVTASFEGEPADNAGHFVEVLVNSTDTKDLQDVSFAVFGAGNHDWVHTYQRIPRLIDDTLEKKGAKRLLARGEGDAGGDRFTESFEEWEDQLWQVLSKVSILSVDQWVEQVLTYRQEYSVEAKEGSSGPTVEVKLVGAPTDRAATLRQPDSRLGLVVENRLLTAADAPPSVILFELPEGMSYQAGDYLAILPSNPPEYVRRVLARFKISPEQEIVLNVAGPTTLPTGKPVSISEVLSGFVEIGQVATKRNVSTLLEHAKDPATRADLEALVSAYSVKDGQPTTSSMLDLLEKYADIDLPLGVFIASLPAMRLRQYSISSSPLWNPSHVTLTVGVVAQGQFLGVASNYLANLRKGDRVQMSVRPSSKGFHPPSQPEVPMVLFAAGSGLAPFRGFIQERAMQKQAGREVGKCVLFFGCRKPWEDYLYSEGELGEWSKLGVVDVRPAFSRAAEESEGQKYVQDRVWHDREVVRESYDKGAKFYTCGGNHVAMGIRDACIRIIAEGKEGIDQERVEEIWKRIQSERYATDVFG